MKLHEILKECGMSRNRLAVKAGIAPSDLYSAMNGNKPFYPSWRKRVAKFLSMDEAMVFPEYQEEQR